jgi:hypothetical protein
MRGRSITIMIMSISKQSLSEADSRLAIQEICSFLRNTKTHFRVHNVPPLVTVLSQVNPIDPSYFF